jgi:hypothetical protein
MAHRMNVLWGLLIALLVICMIWIGFSDYRISKQVETFKQRMISLGTDEQLKETVNTLEKDLNDRILYETHVESDPLDLTKAIQSKSFLASLGLKETLEQQGRMRLSCTVVGDSPSAVIKFMGTSHIVHQGERFNGFLVDQITTAEIVLVKEGSRLVLVNESAPEGELNEGKSSITSGRKY